MATDFAMATVDIPRDETPPLEGVDFDPDYPGSTEEAPYGFKDDGTPYKRRPRGSAKSASKAGKGMPASNASARSAAALLARLNSLIAIALATANMPGTAAAMAENNETFETMAYEALLADPLMCKKILGAGATSGKAGLVMAYSMLGVSLVPAAKIEIQEKRKAKESEYNEEA